MGGSKTAEGIIREGHRGQFDAMGTLRILNAPSDILGGRPAFIDMRPSQNPETPESERYRLSFYGLPRWDGMDRMISHVNRQYEGSCIISPEDFCLMWGKIHEIDGKRYQAYIGESAFGTNFAPDRQLDFDLLLAIGAPEVTIDYADLKK